MLPELSASGSGGGTHLPEEGAVRGESLGVGVRGHVVQNRG